MSNQNLPDLSNLQNFHDLMRLSDDVKEDLIRACEEQQQDILDLKIEGGRKLEAVVSKLRRSAQDVKDKDQELEVLEQEVARNKGINENVLAIVDPILLKAEKKALETEKAHLQESVEQYKRIVDLQKQLKAASWREVDLVKGRTNQRAAELKKQQELKAANKRIAELEEQLLAAKAAKGSGTQDEVAKRAK